MDKPTLIKRGIVALLAVLVITYVIYVICRASFTQVKTISAKETIAYNSVTADCFVIHEEELIEYSGDGVISYAVEDGEKVSVNETVAGVFDSVASAGTKREIERLSTRIASLEQLQQNAGTITLTPDEIDKVIGTYVTMANTALNNGSIAEAEKITGDILYFINERHFVTGKNTDYTDKINELKSRLKELEADASKGKKNKEIKSPSTGYFVSCADGYENAFSISDVGNIMPDDMQPERIKKKEVSENVIGKTISGVYWYIACPVSAEDALRIKNADSLKIDIPVVSGDKIKVELFSVNQKSKSSDAVIILRGTYMNSEMAGLRRGKFSIILDTYQGIYIPKSAVHDKELTRTYTDERGREKQETGTVSGVYVKIGSEVTFKQIIPVFSGDDYIISSTYAEGRFSKDVGVVQVYDDIIVEGANLYDGKIIRAA